MKKSGTKQNSYFNNAYNFNRNRKQKRVGINNVEVNQNSSSISKRRNEPKFNIYTNLKNSFIQTNTGYNIYNHSKDKTNNIKNLQNRSKEKVDLTINIQDKVELTNCDIDFDYLIKKKINNISKNPDETNFVINERGFEEPAGYTKLLDSSDTESETDNVSDDEKWPGDYKLTTEQIEMLNNLQIKLDFNIPEIHYYGTRLNLKLKDRKKAICKGLLCKNGYFYKVEDDIIRKNFNEFCQLHNIPKNPLPFIHMNRDIFQSRKHFHRMGKEFSQFLSKGLSNRFISIVFSRFCKIYGEYKTGRYSDYEDRLIMEYFKKYSGQQNVQTNIQQNINRSKVSLTRRYKNVLQAREDGYKTNLGKDFDELKLIREIMKEANVADVHDLKDYYYKPGFFKRIGEILRIIPMSLKMVYYKVIYPKLFLKERNISRIIQKVLEMLINDKIDDYRKIDYIKYVKQIEGTNRHFITHMVHNLRLRAKQINWIHNILDKLKYMQRWTVRRTYHHIPSIDLSNLHKDNIIS